MLGRAMDISDEEMQTAVAPNYLKRHSKVEIELNAISDRPDAHFTSLNMS